MKELQQRWAASVKPPGTRLHYTGCCARAVRQRGCASFVASLLPPAWVLMMTQGTQVLHPALSHSRAEPAGPDTGSLGAPRCFSQKHNSYQHRQVPHSLFLLITGGRCMGCMLQRGMTALHNLAQCTLGYAPLQGKPRVWVTFCRALSSWFVFWFVPLLQGLERRGMEGKTLTPKAGAQIT